MFSDDDIINKYYQVRSTGYCNGILTICNHLQTIQDVGVNVRKRV
jgi:hypothetical protein